MREKAAIITDELVVFLVGANALCVRYGYMAENSVKMQTELNFLLNVYYSSTNNENKLILLI